MMLRLNKLICSLLKFLFKYIPKSNASHYVSLQRRGQKKREKEMGFCYCFVWHGNNRNKTVFLFYETSEGNSLRSWHFISSNHLRSKIFALAPSVPHTGMAAGAYWSPLLGGLLSTPKAGFGRKKRHLLYWKTSSYLISWKRNVSVNVLKRWLSYIKMSTPEAITPAATSHRSHPEGR